jgi:hypothetical protein
VFNARQIVSSVGLAMMGEGRHPMRNFRDLEGMDALIGALQDAKNTLKKQKDFSGEWEALERRAGEIASELEIFRNGTLENFVSWIERRGRGLFLEACPGRCIRTPARETF